MVIPVYLLSPLTREKFFLILAKSDIFVLFLQKRSNATRS